MIKILLAADMTDKVYKLVEKMEKAALKVGLEAKIKAISDIHIEKEFSNYDVLLVCPNISNKYKLIYNKYNDYLPVEKIPMPYFALADGKSVLGIALGLLE